MLKGILLGGGVPPVNIVNFKADILLNYNTGNLISRILWKHAVFLIDRIFTISCSSAKRLH